MATSGTVVAEAHRRDDSNYPEATNQHSKVIIACTVGGASLILSTGLVFCLLVWRRRARRDKLRMKLRSRRRDSRRARASSPGHNTPGLSGGNCETLSPTPPEHVHHRYPCSPNSADDQGLPLPQNGLWSAATMPPPPSSESPPPCPQPCSATPPITHQSLLPADLLPLANESPFDHVTIAAESGAHGCDIILSLANETQLVAPICRENSRGRRTINNNVGGFHYDSDRLLFRSSSEKMASKMASSGAAHYERVTNNASFGASMITHRSAAVDSTSTPRHQNECFDMADDGNTWEMVSWDHRRAVTASQRLHHRRHHRSDYSDAASRLRSDARSAERQLIDSGDDEKEHPVWVERIPRTDRRPATGQRDEETGLDDRLRREEQPASRLVSAMKRNSEYDNLNWDYMR